MKKIDELLGIFFEKLGEFVLIFYNEAIPFIIFLWTLSSIFKYDKWWETLLNVIVMITSLFILYKNLKSIDNKKN